MQPVCPFCPQCIKITYITEPYRLAIDGQRSLSGLDHHLTFWLWTLLLRPPLKKSLFPVQRVTRIKASREAGIFFFMIFFFRYFFYIVKDKKNTQKKRKKSLNLIFYSHSALIGSPGRWTGNKVIFKGGLIVQPSPSIDQPRPTDPGCHGCFPSGRM